MTLGLEFFLQVWIPAEAVSLLSLWLGFRLADRPLLLRIGKVAHDRKLRSLERTWPLTLLPKAIERKNVALTSAILSALIVTKSIAALLFGAIMIFWLPFAAGVVPSIITFHDPGNARLRSRMAGVSVLQITSHTLAAALGFVWTIRWLPLGAPIEPAVMNGPFLAVVVCGLSVVLAVAAGRLEALAVHRFGL